MSKKQELFIIGNPRSGTSLLRIMLNSHSAIIIPPECGFIQWWFDKYQNWSIQSDLKEFIEDLKTSKKIETWELDYNGLHEFLKECKSQNYEDLVFNVIEFYGISKSGKIKSKVLGDKNNYFIDHLDLLKSLCPNAKFLVILRDPRDIYCSYKGIAELNPDLPYIPKLSQDIESFTKEWHQNQSKVSKFLNNLNRESFLIISYEDLVLDTKKKLDEICSFLEIPFEEKMLMYFETNDEPKALLNWKKKTLQPPDNSSIGKYQILLSPIDIEMIESETFEIYNQLKKNIFSV